MLSKLNTSSIYPSTQCLFKYLHRLIAIFTFFFFSFFLLFSTLNACIVLYSLLFIGFFAILNYAVKKNLSLSWTIFNGFINSLNGNTGVQISQLLSKLLLITLNVIDSIHICEIDDKMLKRIQLIRPTIYGIEFCS